MRRLLAVLIFAPILVGILLEVFASSQGWYIRTIGAYLFFLIPLGVGTLYLVSWFSWWLISSKPSIGSWLILKPVIVIASWLLLIPLLLTLFVVGAFLPPEHERDFEGRPLA